MPYLPNADPILILASALVIGVALGALAKRVKLPAVTGQILAGVLIGQVGFEVFDPHSVEQLQPLTHFALGLIAVSVGAHLNVRRLRNAGRRLLTLVLLESLLVPGFVFAGLSFFPDLDWSIALLMGALAISTAPATIVAIVKETRSRGVFVKTLVAAVALNNMACIAGFELMRLVAHRSLGDSDMPVPSIFLGAFVQLLLAAATGTAAAVGMAVVVRLVRRPEILTTAGFIAILLTIGIANYLGYSPLLACLFLGLAQTNVTRERGQVVDAIFANLEPAILAIFFTLAGMALSFEHAGEAGVLALVFFLTRGVGKVAAGNLAMRLAGATEKLRKNIGMALIPQAGVAVGLVILLEHDPILKQAGGDVLEVFVAVVLTAVVANEIVGPILTRVALARAGEIGHDRGRLIDFIHEENILTDLRADTPQEAIQQLTALLIQSHHLEPSAGDTLLKSVLEREEQTSTCLGGGLAVPHGVLPDGLSTVGVMGVSRKGLQFDTPDGRPVHCIVLLASPVEAHARHLQILAMLARTIGMNRAIQTQLFNAQSPAHAYEILHHEEAEDFNYFLEDLA